MCQGKGLDVGGAIKMRIGIPIERVVRAGDGLAGVRDEGGDEAVGVGVGAARGALAREDLVDVVVLGVDAVNGDEGDEGEEERALHLRSVRRGEGEEARLELGRS